MQINLEILSPDKTVYCGNVDSVQIISNGKSFGVLYNHAPMIVAIKNCKINIKANGQRIVYLSESAVIKVCNNKVTILVEIIKQQ